MRRGGCLELYYCNMVDWFWWDSSLIFDNQLVFFQCFDTVGLVVWPVKIVPEMTYNVLSGTLNPTHSHSLTLVDSAERIESNSRRIRFVWPCLQSPCQLCVPVGNRTGDNRAVL